MIGHFRANGINSSDHHVVESGGAGIDVGNNSEFTVIQNNAVSLPDVESKEDRLDYHFFGKNRFRELCGMISEDYFHCFSTHVKRVSSFHLLRNRYDDVISKVTKKVMEVVRQTCTEFEELIAGDSDYSDDGGKEFSDDDTDDDCCLYGRSGPRERRWFRCVKSSDVQLFVKALLSNVIYDFGFRVKSGKTNQLFPCFSPLHDRFVPLYKELRIS